MGFELSLPSGVLLVMSLPPPVSLLIDDTHEHHMIQDAKMQQTEIRLVACMFGQRAVSWKTLLWWGRGGGGRHTLSFRVQTWPISMWHPLVQKRCVHLVGFLHRRR